MLTSASRQRYTALQPWFAQDEMTTLSRRRTQCLKRLNKSNMPAMDERWQRLARFYKCCIWFAYFVRDESIGNLRDHCDCQNSGYGNCEITVNNLNVHVHWKADSQFANWHIVSPWGDWFVHGNHIPARIDSSSPNWYLRWIWSRSVCAFVYSSRYYLDLI